MYLLVDRTNYRLIARHESFMAVVALAYIQFSNVDTGVIKCGSDAQYGPLDNAELRSMALSAGYELPAGKRKEIIGPFRQLVETAEWLALPFDVDQLIAQAWKIKPSDATPYAFDPNSDTPTPLAEWHFPPNVKRRRDEGQNWVYFASEALSDRPTGQNSPTPWNSQAGDGRMALRNNNRPHQQENDMAAAKKTAPAAPAKKTAAPAAPKAAKTAAPAAPKAEKAPKAPKAPKVEKAPREEQNGARRPKAGTVGEKIWNAADKLSAKAKSPAPFADVLAALEGQDVAEASARAGYQRWRKFNGLKGRLSTAAE